MAEAVAHLFQLPTVRLCSFEPGITRASLICQAGSAKAFAGLIATGNRLGELAGASLLARVFLHRLDAIRLGSKELVDLFDDDFHRREIRDWTHARLNFRHMPRVAALVLGDPHLERAGQWAVRLHLAHVSAGGLLGVDLRLSQGHESGDVAGNRPGGLGAAEELKETVAALLVHEEAGAVHAHRILFLGTGRDVLELVALGVVVGNDRFFVTQVECLEAAGQRENVDAVSQLDDLLVRLGNPVGAGRDKSLVDGVPLAEQLQATEELGVPRHLLELLVGAELGGRKLGEIDGLQGGTHKKLLETRVWNWKLGMGTKSLNIYLHIQRLLLLSLTNGVLLFSHTRSIKVADPTQARVEPVQR